MHSPRTAVLERDQRVSRNLPFYRHAVELALRGPDILVDMPRAAGWQELRATGTAQWTQIVVGHHRDARHLHGGVVGRILNHVEGPVPKIAFVADAVSTTKTGLAIPEEIVSKSNARSPRTPCGVPQLTNRT